MTTFEGQGASQRTRGAKAPPCGEHTGGVVAGAGVGGAEGTRGQGGLGPELNPSHSCQIRFTIG